MPIDATTTQLITAFAAVVSAIVAPMVALRIARRQIRATVVSAARQKWVDGLRDDIADLITVDDKARHLHFEIHSVHGFHDAVKTAEFNAALERRFLLRCRIRLRLDTSRSSHEELARLVDKLDAERPVKGDPLPDEIIVVAKQIIAEELLLAEAGK